jgi:hypothetical protein
VHRVDGRGLREHEPGDALGSPSGGGERVEPVGAGERERRAAHVAGVHHRDQRVHAGLEPVVVCRRREREPEPRQIEAHDARGRERGDQRRVVLDHAGSVGHHHDHRPVAAGVADADRRVGGVDQPHPFEGDALSVSVPESVAVEAVPVHAPPVGTVPRARRVGAIGRRRAGDVSG